jgi:hypothetical protein
MQKNERKGRAAAVSQRESERDKCREEEIVFIELFIVRSKKRVLKVFREL